ncbi:MAG TPA: tetratricopeptide repeat protein [Pirellulales bacterium]|nr:tetratricopeptide repeat protein [Pirellulales bacterium]
MTKGERLRARLLNSAARAMAVLLAFSAAEAQETKPDNAATRDYAVAVGFENKQLFPQAAARWQKFVETYRNDSRLDRAHYHLATCQLEMGEADKAAAAYRNLLGAFPNFKDRDAAQFNLALALYQIGLKSKKADELKAAADGFAQVAANYPQSKHLPPALFYQAEALYAAGQTQPAADLYEKLIGTYPNSDLLPHARFALGVAQQEAGQDGAAAATFQAFLSTHAQDPQTNEARLRLGLSLMGLKKYGDAAQVLSQAAAATDFALADLALLRQAQCLAEQKDAGSALSLYNNLPGRFPKSKYIGAAQGAAGKLLCEQQAYPQAQQTLAAAVASAGDAAPEAAYWLAKTLVKLNQVPAALAELDKAIQSYPQSRFLPSLRLGRIDVLYEMPERRKETVTLYRQFAEQNAGHDLAPQAAYMGGLAALTVGEHAEAHRQATAFLENARYQTDPLVPEVMFVAAESLVLAGEAVDPLPQVAKAESLYRQIVERFPKHRHVPASRVRIGLCLYLQKKLDPAIAYLSESLPQLSDPDLLAEAQFTLGRAQHDAGRPPQAVAAFRESLRVKPDWPHADEVLLALGGSLRMDHKLDEAAGEWNRLVVTQPKSPYRAQALYGLGEIAEQQKKYDDAIRHFEQVLNEFAGSPFAAPAAYGIGKAKFAKDDFAGAVSALNIVVERFSSSEVAGRARYARGLAQQRLKQYAPALADLQAFLAGSPPASDVPDARYAVALCQLALKRPDQAAETLKRLVEEAPNYPRGEEAYYELGFALSEAKQDRAAADAWRTLAQKFPASGLAADAWFRVGEYHESNKEWPQAADAYERGRQQAKAADLQEKLQFKLGWTRYQAGEFSPAAAVFRSQIEAFPAGKLVGDATYLAGESLYRQQQYGPALERFNQSIGQRNEKYLARALYRAGDCAARLTQWSASEGHYQTLVNQFPKFEQVNEARYGLGWAQQNQDKLPEARRTYEQVTKETDTETAAKSRFMIGECAFREKKYDEAVEHYLTAALGYPYEEWQVLGYLEAGRSLVELKNLAKARDMFETLIKKYPNHPKAADAAKLLASIKK